ncbi:MAG: hypothetical protein ACOYU0_03705 [Nitrospirota bacterium]
MAKKIYELVYKLKCLDFEFVRTNWKVFNSETEAKAFGRKEQDELNGGLPPTEKANDGYCYIFWYTQPVEQVDGYQICFVEGAR